MALPVEVQGKDWLEGGRRKGLCCIEAKGLKRNLVRQRIRSQDDLSSTVMPLLCLYSCALNGKGNLDHLFQRNLTIKNSTEYQIVNFTRPRIPLPRIPQDPNQLEVSHLIASSSLPFFLR